MIDQVRRKIDESELPVIVGDMATTTVPGEFSLVVLVWNSISNLRTMSRSPALGTPPIIWRQVDDSSSNSGCHLSDVYAGQNVVPMSLDEGHLVFDTYDLVTQECTSHHYYREQDGSTRNGSGIFPLHLAF